MKNQNQSIIGILSVGMLTVMSFFIALIANLWWSGQARYIGCFDIFGYPWCPLQEGVIFLTAIVMAFVFAVITFSIILWGVRKLGDWNEIYKGIVSIVGVAGLAAPFAVLLIGIVLFFIIFIVWLPVFLLIGAGTFYNIPLVIWFLGVVIIAVPVVVRNMVKLVGK